MSAPLAVVLRNARARRAVEAVAPAVLASLGARWRVEVRTPDDAAATTRAAREAVDAGADAVIAAGGDGTVSAVAQALAGTDVPLGILAAGTANDLARALGLPRTPGDAARALVAATARAVDLVRANDDARFCTVGGLGIVSHSALAVTALKTRGGLARAAAVGAGAAIYKLTAAAALLGRAARPRTVVLSRIAPHGARHDESLEVHGLFVANQRFLGGGLALPSGSRDDDGAFELCCVLRSPRARLLEAFARLSAGLPIPDGVLRVLPATEAHVVCAEPDTLLGDGDALATGRVFHLRAEPGALRVLV